MCTVSYVPLNNGFVLTTSRDEIIGRPSSSSPDFHVTDPGLSLYYPQDPVGMGSWIAASEDERVICLLNGAYKIHAHRPPYDRSRGRVLLEAFEYQSPFEFYKKIDLTNIEPFTLVLVWAGLLYEMRWDGANKYFLSLPNVPYLWASAPLYSKEVLAIKKNWLNEYLQEKDQPSPSDMLYFHEFGGVNDKENGMKISRSNGLQTLSITSIGVVEHEVEVLQNTFNGKLFEDSWPSQFADEQF